MKKFIAIGFVVALALVIVGVSPEPVGAAQSKTEMCHFDNGSSVSRHLDHGDCDEFDNGGFIDYLGGDDCFCD